ncbi:MAG TPA: zf-HC2 domain-containing protein [Candidatus Ruthenibacterium merdigallinarum]|nr:zf-HC2 domain-containing protein [Candidatus Ruthenibacterium merdigallinarum]
MNAERLRGITADISCDVCRDLMPLAADGAASADSEALVKAHVAHCAACAELWRACGGAVLRRAPDDARVLRRLRRALALRALALLALGGLGCFAAAALGTVRPGVALWALLGWGALARWAVQRAAWPLALAVGCVIGAVEWALSGFGLAAAGACALVALLCAAAAALGVLTASLLAFAVTGRTARARASVFASAAQAQPARGEPPAQQKSKEAQSDETHTDE